MSGDSYVSFVYYMNLTMQPFVFKLRRFFAVLARFLGPFDGKVASSAARFVRAEMVGSF